MDKQMVSALGLLDYMRSDYRSDEEILVGAMDKDMVGTDFAPFHARFYDIFYFILLFWGPTRKPSLKPELLKQFFAQPQPSDIIKGEVTKMNMITYHEDDDKK